MAKTTTNLTEEDIKTLKKEIQILRYVILGFLIFCSGLSLVLINGTERFYAIGVIIAMTGIGYLFGNWIFKKDIDSGIKNVFIGTVAKIDARHSGINEKETAYYVTIDNDEVQISFNDYNKFKEGQKIELHITEKTSTILKLVYN